MAKTTKKKQHYVDNKQLFQAMVEFRKSVAAAKKAKQERPMVTNYIGDCIMKIAVHLSTRPQFSSYTFREEMICDGIENCLQYIDNFNPKKSENPFAYFTQIIYYAFLRRIKKEKKELYTKYKISQSTIVGSMTNRQGHDTQDYSIGARTSEWSTEHIDTFIEEFENKKREKKAAQKKVGDAPAVKKKWGRRKENKNDAASAN